MFRATNCASARALSQVVAGGIHEGVEPEVFADFTGAGGVLYIGEAILHGVGGVRACGAEQLHALLFFETGQIVNGLFAEDETGQQKDCQ